MGLSNLGRWPSRPPSWTARFKIRVSLALDQPSTPPSAPSRPGTPGPSGPAGRCCPSSGPRLTARPASQGPAPGQTSHRFRLSGFGSGWLSTGFGARLVCREPCARSVSRARRRLTAICSGRAARAARCWLSLLHRSISSRLRKPTRTSAAHDAGLRGGFTAAHPLKTLCLGTVSREAFDARPRNILGSSRHSGLPLAGQS